MQEYKICKDQACIRIHPDRVGTAGPDYPHMPADTFLQFIPVLTLLVSQSVLPLYFQLFGSEPPLLGQWSLTRAEGQQPAQRGSQIIKNTFWNTQPEPLGFLLTEQPPASDAGHPHSYSAGHLFSCPQNHLQQPEEKASHENRPIITTNKIFKI